MQADKPQAARVEIKNETERTEIADGVPNGADETAEDEKVHPLIAHRAILGRQISDRNEENQPLTVSRTYSGRRSSDRPAKVEEEERKKERRNHMDGIVCAFLGVKG